MEDKAWRGSKCRQHILLRLPHLKRDHGYLPKGPFPVLLRLPCLRIITGCEPLWVICDLFK